MKVFFSYVLTLFLITGFIVVIFWFTHPNFGIEDKESISPLPDFLTLSKNNQVSSMDIFLPVIDFLTPQNDVPQISANGVIVYNITTNKTLFSKNPKKRYPMASLTKIMTAMLGIDNKLISNQYVVKKEYLVGENSMGLLPGETHSLENLLYGLILLSGNDAAETIANHYQKGRSEFVRAMNKKAYALGLKDTNFTNPSGLEGDGDQYSTAYDLMVMTKYALTEYPFFKKVAGTVSYSLPATAIHQEYYLENETNLLTSYPGVKGVKTGYTPEAGLCLVTYLEYKDHKIIAVLLGSQNRRAEMKELLDYSLKQEGITPPKHE